MSTETTARTLPCTWTDYQSWNDGQRWEIIDGEVFAMSPAPSTRHQGVVLALAMQVSQRLEGHPCTAFIAPIDVRLSDEDVVQPDLIVVCDKDRIKPTHIDGAPDLVVEVLSPSTALYDRTRKMRLYAAAGVKEVWLVTPYPWLVEVYVLDGSTFRLVATHSKDETLRSPTLPAVRIELAKVFDFPLEPGEAIEMVKEGRPPYGAKDKTAK